MLGVLEMIDELVSDEWRVCLEMAVWRMRQVKSGLFMVDEAIDRTERDLNFQIESVKHLKRKENDR